MNSIENKQDNEQGRISTGTHDSEKEDRLHEMVKDEIVYDQKENEGIIEKIINNNMGYLTLQTGKLCNKIPLNDEKTEFGFAKELFSYKRNYEEVAKEEISIEEARTAIAQAFYSMIVNTPAIIGKTNIKIKENDFFYNGYKVQVESDHPCIIYKYINYPNAGKDNDRNKWNMQDKNLRTHIEIHSMLYGLIDRMRNTLKFNNKLCGFDIDNLNHQSFAFCEECLPHNRLSLGDSFLDAKHSRMDVVKEECKKLANFDYDEFLHRCVRNFQILGIENDRTTWETLNEFMNLAKNYKERLKDEFFTEERTNRKASKCCITKLKDNLLGYGDKYDAPGFFHDAIKEDWDHFNEFFKKIKKQYKFCDLTLPSLLRLDKPVGNIDMTKIINDYGKNYRLNQSKNTINNGNSKINGENKDKKIIKNFK